MADVRPSEVEQQPTGRQPGISAQFRQGGRIGIADDWNLLDKIYIVFYIAVSCRTRFFFLLNINIPE